MRKMDGFEMSDVSEHDIEVKEEFSGIHTEKMTQCYVKMRKCKESFKEVLIDHKDDSGTCDDDKVVNESDETNNNELAMQMPESFVKIKKFGASEVPLNLKQDANENLRGGTGDGTSSTVNIYPRSSLPRYPSSATQAPLTAMFLPAASSDQNLATSTQRATPLDPAASVAKLMNCSQVAGHPAGRGADSDLTQLGQLTRQDSVRNTIPSQSKRMKLAPDMKPLTPGFLSPRQSRAVPGKLTPTWTPSRGRQLLTKSRSLPCQGQSLVQNDKYPFPGSIPVDSTDLPAGAPRTVTSVLQVPNAGHPNEPGAATPIPFVSKIYDSNTPTGSITPIIQSIEKDTTTPRKSPGLSEESLYFLKSIFLPNQLLPIPEVPATEYFASLLPNRASSSRSSRKALPVQKLSPLIQQAQPTSGQLLPATLLPAQSPDPRLLPKSLSSSNTSNCRPTVPPKRLPPLIQEVLPTSRQASPSSVRFSQGPSSTPSSVIPESSMEPSHSSHVLPLPTLAKALATLGGKDEGSRNLVLFNLTNQEIKALNTLGLKEVGILE